MLTCHHHHTRPLRDPYDRKKTPSRAPLTNKTEPITARPRKRPRHFRPRSTSHVIRSNNLHDVLAAGVVRAAAAAAAVAALVTAQRGGVLMRGGSGTPPSVATPAPASTAPPSVPKVCSIAILRVAKVSRRLTSIWCVARGLLLCWI